METTKKRMGRPKTSQRADISVKIDESIVEMARMVALHKKVSIAVLLSDMLEAPMKRAHEEMLNDLMKKGRTT